MTRKYEMPGDLASLFSDQFEYDFRIGFTKMGLISHALEYSRSERLGLQELEKLQVKKLKKLLKTAHAQSKFWHDRFRESKILPSDIQTHEDLKKIRPSSKREMLSYPTKDLLTCEPEKCARRKTSGTTGPPMPVYWSGDFSGCVKAAVRFQFARYFGLSYFYRGMNIVFANLSSGKQTLNTNNSHGQQIYSHFWRVVPFSSQVEEIIPAIIDQRPDFIWSTPSYFRMLADYKRKNGIPGFCPRALSPSGELLDDPTRNYLRNTFDCDIYDMYGASEAGLIAIECSNASGMHIQMSGVILELLDDNDDSVSPGEKGEVVLTVLDNDAMPFIRYRMKDFAILSPDPCSCGRHHPILRSLEGRSSDSFPLPNGTLVSSRTLSTIIHEFDSLPRVQLVQSEKEEVRVRFFTVDRNHLPEEQINGFLRRIESVLPGVNLSISIEDAQGLKAKFRPTVSEIGEDRETRWNDPFYSGKV